jgi:leucyl-tRNA synthetase
MDKEYQPEQIETNAQKFWETNNCFAVNENSKKPKFYCLSMLPYPSGQIHMGHARNYTIGDVITRYQYMLGKNVLQPFGWDAFGLPAENAALERKLAPAKWTYQNIAQMRDVIKRLGYAIDWSREVTTCKPEYYKWEQWLFLKMFNKGLAYKKQSVVNWDPVDQTVLANEQVVNGCGWRSGAPVERREISQWFLKITAYAEELLNDLDKLTGWPEQVVTMQRNWIGRSEGLELCFVVTNAHGAGVSAGVEQKISVFTTRPDTLFGVTYLSIAPQHPITLAAAQKNPAIATFIKKYKNIKVAEAELATLPKEGVYTGFDAIHPLTGAIIPIWAANFVLMEYGTGAVMSVPGHDQRDYEFAKQYAIAIQQVITPSDNSAWDFNKTAFTAHGILVNSGDFSNLTSEQACNAIAERLSKTKQATRKINYRLRDWGISRQRYWGAPIPIIYCDKCGALPVRYEDLPTILPENIKLTDPRSPLAKLTSFTDTICYKCGAKAQRETDTFDTFMESSWYFARYCCPNQNQGMLDERANYWLPVDQYIGGIEHAVMHLLYARFIYKVMCNENLVTTDEPFTNLLTQGMVLKDGSKMSKSKGNVVSPETMIKKYGADTARLFIIFASPPTQTLEWSDSGVEGAHRFLKKVWSFAYQNQELMQKLNSATVHDYSELAPKYQAIRRQMHLILQQANQDLERLQLNTVVSAVMKLFNLLQELSSNSHDNNDNSSRLIFEGFSILLRLLNPITPHLAHHLWQELHFGKNIMEHTWPTVDTAILKQANIDYIIQINGKLRGKIAIPATADNKQIEALALANENVSRYLDKQTIKKIIIVSKKLINIVI